MSQGQPAADHPPRGFLPWLAGQSRRFALWSPVALGTGAALYFALLTEPPLWTGWAAGLVLLALFLMGRFWLGTILTGLAFVALGYAASVMRAEMLSTPVLRAPLPAQQIAGVVEDAFVHRDGKPRVILRLTEASAWPGELGERRVRIALRKTDAVPRPGSAITVKARLSPLTLPVTPGGFDFARAAWFSRIGAYGFALGPPQGVVSTQDTTWLERFWLWVGGVRHDASQRIHTLLPGGPGAIAAALTVGDRGQIPARDEEALRDSSLAHVLSISGLHMAIVGLGVFGLLRFVLALAPPVALRWNIKKWAAAAALLTCAAYLVLSGMSVPAERSFLMLGLVFVAVLVDRAAITLRMVAISAFLIILIAPESVVDPSFQMSFAAVTGLVAFFEWFEDWQRRRPVPLFYRDTWAGRLSAWLAIAILSSAVAGLATAPFAAFHFNRVALYGVVANVAAMPVISFIIMPFAMLGLVLMPFGLDAWAFHVAGWGLEAMLAIAHWTASLPGASGHAPSWSVSALVLVTLGALWLALWRGPWRLLGLAGVAAAFVIGAFAPVPDILIDRELKNVALRSESGRLALLSGRRGAFAATEWLERDGDSSAVRDAARLGRESVWSCVDGLCAAEIKGARIGYLEKRGDARTACAQGFDLLIAAREVASCGHGLTLTPSMTAEQGALAISVGEGGAMSITTVRDMLGVRRWTVWP